ncbi:hypothetical protein TEHN7128_0330 [Tetragenococcus halophilus subsp. halophilus]|uniref:hypothetical protein n=1 Tax=Tetragenococcus halophilus TaxID=51669 RepID=UPI000CBC8023|nr:hypothetical protein [Tetragenococcus halophilus]MCO8284489.1 hypothetical protein [Tetragenococcus halophilus]GBD65927.1 hypothetical protein TEHN7116_0891 [Tetragenococcus halophilus subsp. halophilus]GBD77101.1 hypothetical protein TEHN7128_0330 [Tetragenococcus halophilus subsp. halophilus]
MEKEEVLEMFKNLKEGQSLTVDSHELKLCNELKEEGRIDFKAVPMSLGDSENSKTELVDPNFKG